MTKAKVNVTTYNIKDNKEYNNKKGIRIKWIKHKLME